MKTVRYTSHTIKTTDGKFISCKPQVEAILEMVYSGKDDTLIDGKKVSIFSDKIETVGGGKKIHRTRVTVVEVGDD